MCFYNLEKRKLFSQVSQMSTCHSAIGAENGSDFKLFLCEFIVF